MNNLENKELTIIDLIKSIKENVRFLFSKWILILLITFMGGIAGITYAWLKKPEYIAVLTFFTEGDAKSGLGMYASIAAQFGLDLGSSGGGGAFEGDNLMELLKSRTLVKKTLLSPIESGAKNLMIDKYLLINQLNKDWENKPAYRNIHFEESPKQFDRVRDSIVDKVYENIIKSELEIEKRDKKVDLIDVKMKSSDEYFGKRFVELLTINAIHYYTDYKIKKSRQNVEVLQKQTDSVKNSLSGNISQVAEMNDVNVNPLKQVVRTGVQRKQIDLQANSLLYAELLKNLELSKLALRRETPLIQVVDVPSLPLKNQKPGRFFSGIIGAFLFGFFIVSYLITKRWLQKHGVISLSKK